MRLTEYQRRAILARDKRIAVIACPGSGKTTVLTRRIQRLVLEGVSPKSIYALTFTNKAAEELKERLIRDPNYPTFGVKVSTSTFHGFALRIIRDFGTSIGIPQNFTIYNEDDRSDIIDSILIETGRKKHFTRKAIDASIKEWLENGTLKERDTFRPVLEEYLGRLKSYNGMDFDVLIKEAIRCLADLSGAPKHYRKLYEHFLIDEAQDTDNNQECLLKLIAPHNIFYVADIDQCIYEWRSAKPEILLGMLEDSDVRVIRLQESHRCTSHIADVANHVISKNENRFEKDIITVKSGPEVRWLGFEGYWDEATFVWDYVESLIDKGQEPKEIFVLARTRRQLRGLSNKYLEGGFEFEIEDVNLSTSMWSSTAVRSLISSLKLVLNSSNQYHAKKSVFSHAKDIQKLITKSLFEDTSLFEEMKATDVAMRSFFDAYNDTSDITSALGVLVGYSKPDMLEIGLKTQHQVAFDFADYISEVWKKDRESTSIRSFLEWYAVKSIQDYVDFESNKVKLMTIHAAKGLEATTVILAGVNKGTFPSNRSDIEEERRLFYVAVTRAKERLVVCYARENASVFVEDRHGILE